MKQNINPIDGFLLLISCLNDMLDKSGKRDELVNQLKGEIISTYDTVQNFMPVEDIQNILKINEQKVFRLRTSGRCDNSISKNCLKLIPNQLSLCEQNLIKTLLEDESYKHLPISYIWAQAQNQGLVMSINTL